MTRSRIICIGNPYQPEDWVGPAVHGVLSRQPLPAGVELIDGGLQGLNLLRMLEQTEQVIFADTLREDLALTPHCVVIEDPFAASDALCFGHGGGLGYLLNAARATQPGLPRMRIVGARADAPRREALAVAKRCLELAHEL